MTDVEVRMTNEARSRIHEVAQRRIRASVWIPAVLLWLVGCGESGPKMYELTGIVTYDGAPLPVGHIRFEPQQGIRTRETVTQSLIKNGRYELKVTGGPHRVMIRDMAGEYDLPDVQNARSLFVKEYRTEIDLPLADDVEQTVTHDFDVPGSHP